MGNDGEDRWDYLGFSIDISPDTYSFLDHKYLGSVDSLVQLTFATAIVNALQSVIGDCAKIGLKITSNRKVRVTEGLKNPGWKGIKPGTIVNVPIYRISYSDEKAGCKCNPCWQDLKAALGKRKVITIYPTDTLSNAKAIPGTGPVEINPDMNFTNPEVNPDGSTTETKVPFEVALWHELIGHAQLAKEHPKTSANYSETYDGKYVDPTIAIENMARDCLRKNGKSVRNRVGWYWPGRPATGFDE